MSRWSSFLACAAGLMALRLISMYWVPLADTSEPRYAEIARLMMETGDWITPWFEPGTPFWGKPPLAFWAQALSFRVFGVTELAARLPSWLATGAAAWLIWSFTAVVNGYETAKLAVIVYMSCAVVFVLSGAVLTDPFLALAVTWCMVSAYLCTQASGWIWRYGFFCGLALGLLAKGPLTLPLVFGPLCVWCLVNRNARSTLRSLPWASGLLLTATLTVPWYRMAEIKTPGFLNYFLLGEHVMRFIDPGWTGDLYGNGHREATGTIWIFALAALFPWSLIACYLLLRRLGAHRVKAVEPVRRRSSKQQYLLIWTLFPLVFFTLSSNILWTYVLPVAGPFAVLLAIALRDLERPSKSLAVMLPVLPYIVPAVTILLVPLLLTGQLELRSEKSLIKVALAAPAALHQSVPVYYYGEQVPFSARFYSAGQARPTGSKLLADLVPEEGWNYLAVPKRKLDEVQRLIGHELTPMFLNRRYALVKLFPAESVPTESVRPSVASTDSRRYSFDEL